MSRTVYNPYVINILIIYRFLFHDDVLYRDTDGDLREHYFRLDSPSMVKHSPFVDHDCRKLLSSATWCRILVTKSEW